MSSQVCRPFTTQIKQFSNASKNLSCLLYGAGDVKFEDQPMPVIDDPNDVIIRVEYVGVCGSDVSQTPRAVLYLSALFTI